MSVRSAENKQDFGLSYWRSRDCRWIREITGTFSGPEHDYAVRSIGFRRLPELRPQEASSPPLIGLTVLTVSLVDLARVRFRLSHSLFLFFLFLSAEIYDALIITRSLSPLKINDPKSQT